MDSGQTKITDTQRIITFTPLHTYNISDYRQRERRTEARDGDRNLSKYIDGQRWTESHTKMDRDRQGLR